MSDSRGALVSRELRKVTHKKGIQMPGASLEQNLTNYNKIY